MVKTLKAKTEIQSLKSKDLKKIGAVKKQKCSRYQIDISDIKETDYGCELFLKAWKLNGHKIGFGVDGTVETERVRLVIGEDARTYRLVEDENGEEELSFLNDDESVTVKNYRHDPKAALIQKIEAVIDSIKKDGKNIVPGKVGNTVTVVDQTTTTGDQLLSDGKASWALARDATTGTVSNMSGAGAQNWCHSSDLGTFFVRRVQIGFDTSAIADTDVVSAATMTVYSSSSGGADTNGYDVVLLNNTDAGTSSPLVAGDFDGFPTASIGSLDLTSLTNQGANVAITITDFDAINLTGTTLIGVRLSGDIDNTTPTGSNVLRIDQAQDYPFLTITHAEAATENALSWCNF